MFIVFEGIDGSGKTTQAKILYKNFKLKGRKCILTSEPTNGPIGNFINFAMKSKKIDDLSLQIFFTADRAYHVLKTIRPALEKGIDVITDRYILSTVVYGSAAGLRRGWLKRINENFPKPDITFIMDVDVNIALERMTERAMKFVKLNRNSNAKINKVERQSFGKIDFLEKARREYILLSKEKGNFLIDSNRSKEEIEKDIISIVRI